MDAAVAPANPQLDGRKADVDKRAAAVRQAADFSKLPADVSRILSDTLGRLSALRLQAARSTEKSHPVERDEQPRVEHTPARGSSPSLSTRAVYVEDVFRKIQIRPYVKGKQTEGLRVTGLDKVPLAGMLGLKNGDVIQTINGQRLTSKQKAFQVLMKAKTQSKIDMQLQRDGKQKSLSFNI